jgi:hypothetical protein
METLLVRSFRTNLEGCIDHPAVKLADCSVWENCFGQPGKLWQDRQPRLHAKHRHPAGFRLAGLRPLVLRVACCDAVMP